MNKVNNEMINLIVDTFDQAVMIYYEGRINEREENTAVTNYDIEKGRLNYYICLIDLIDAFLENKTLVINEKSYEQIMNLFDNLHNKIEENGLNNEEVRRAMLLLDINGFKNINFDLDMITPDVISLIICFILEPLLKENQTILDGNFGIGNLIFTLSTHLSKEFKIIGVENHGLLADVAVHKANMMNLDISLYHQDILEYTFDGIDYIVSDIASYQYENAEYHSYLYDKGVKYFPYLYLEHNLSIPSEHIGIYLVNNDFFTQPGNELFRETLKDKAYIHSFITLPESLFLNKENTKSIMIIKKTKELENKKTDIYMLPNISEKDKFMEIISVIQESLKD